MLSTHTPASGIAGRDSADALAARQSWRLLWAATRGKRLLMAAGIGLIIAQAAIVLVLPWLAGSVVQEFTTRAGAMPSLMLALGVFAAMALLSLWMAGAVSSVVETLSARMTESIHDRLMSLRMGWHAHRSRGDCAALIARDVPAAVNGAMVVFLGIPSALVTAVGAIALMLGISSAAAIAVLVPLPLFVIALKYAGRRLGRLSREESDAAAALDAYASESIHRLAPIKLFNLEPARQQRLAVIARRWTGARRAVALFLARQAAAVAIAASIVGAGYLAYVGPRAFSDSLTLAELVRIVGYATVMVGPLATLASTYGSIRRLHGSLARLGSVPPLESPMSERRAAPTAPLSTPPRLTLSNVRFQYATAAGPLLDGLDLVVEPGARVGIVGENGSGKSTLAHLLVRFLDGWEGAIELSGRSIADIPHREVRDVIGLVPQAIELFDGSLADNLRVAAPLASDETLRDVMARVGLDRWLDRLPEGLETAIGENGGRISGGQRQRIAIARALLSNAQILVLDEATSMLDAEGENELVHLLDRELQGRTVVVVTHRPAALRLAKTHYRLERGRLSPLVPATGNACAVA